MQVLLAKGFSGAKSAEKKKQAVPLDPLMIPSSWSGDDSVLYWALSLDASDTPLLLIFELHFSEMSSVIISVMQSVWRFQPV